MDERLLRLEERLALLKAIPSDASVPFLKPEATLQSSLRKGADGQVDIEWGRRQCDSSVDFDFCFKFPSPCYIDHLKDEGSDKDEAKKKARLAALKKALEAESQDNEWFAQELESRRQSFRDLHCASRFPKRRTSHRPSLCEEMSEAARQRSIDIKMLFCDFLVERRDRQALRVLHEVDSLNDARIMALSLVLDFFHREQELYETCLFQSVDHDEIFLCVKMAEETAARHAEESNFRVELKQEELAAQLGVAIPRTGPQPPAFSCFSSYLAEAGLMKDLSKQSEDDATALFRKADRIKLLYDRVTDVLDLDAMRQWRLLLDFYPVHSKSGHNALKTRISHFWILEPPLDEIKNYFGSQIALYFLFASLLSQALCWLTAAVMLLTVYVAVKENSIRAAFYGFLYGNGHWEVRVAFSVILIIWMQVFDLKLKAKVKWYRVVWGEEDYLGATFVKDRFSPRFQGVLMESEVDHAQQVLGVPEKRKVRGRHISKLLTGLFGAIVCSVMFGIYLVAAAFDRRGYHYAFTICGYFISVAIQVFQALWDKIANTMIDMEYHLLEVDFFHSWALKTVVIQMICSFSPFVYIGFVMPHVDQCPTTHGGNCFEYLCYEMVIVFLSYNVFTLWDIFYPIICMKAKKYSEKRAAEKMGHDAYSLGFLELQSKMNEYDSSCLSEDYCEHILPLAFVMLFGITLPCSPALALTSSFFQLHCDAFKLSHYMQRPYPTVASRGLGVWAEILESVAYLAVYTNVGIISFLLGPFSSYSFHWQLLVFFGLSTCVHMGRHVIAVLLPVEDSTLLLAMERQKRQNEVVNKVVKQHAASLLVPKPQSHLQRRGHIPPSELLRRAEEAIKPLAFTVRADLDLKNVPRLGKDSKYFEDAFHTAPAN